MNTYLSYAERGRTAWWRYLLTLVAGLMLAVLALALLSAGLAFLRLPPRDLALQMQNPTDPRIFFAAIATVFAALGIGLAAAAALVFETALLRGIGAWHWRLALGGLLLWLAVQVVLSGIDFALAPSGFSWTGHATPVLALWAFGGILVQTFTEEFIFRGLIFGGLRRSMPLAAAMAASAAIFAVVHPPTSMLPVFILGLCTAWAYERSKSLLSPMLTHAIYNAAMLALQY